MTIKKKFEKVPTMPNILSEITLNVKNPNTHLPKNIIQNHKKKKNKHTSL